MVFSEFSSLYVTVKQTQMFLVFLPWKTSQLTAICSAVKSFFACLIELQGVIMVYLMLNIIFEIKCTEMLVSFNQILGRREASFAKGLITYSDAVVLIFPHLWRVY